MPGFIAVRENLENLKKVRYFEKVRENLKKSGETERKAGKLGKSQGILIFGTQNVFLLLENIDFETFLIIYLLLLLPDFSR